MKILAGGALAGITALAIAGPAHASAGWRLHAPAPGQRDVSIDSSIVLKFNEPMHMRSVEAAVRIDPPAACHFQWNADLTELRCGLGTPLAPDTGYQVRLAYEVKTARETKITPGDAVYFETGAAPEPSARPRMVATSLPPNSQTLFGALPPYAAMSPITLYFDAAMDRASTEGAVRFPRDVRMTGAFSWSADSTAVTFTPALPWGHHRLSRVSSVVVDIAARSQARKHLAEQGTAAFVAGNFRDLLEIPTYGCPATIAAAAGAPGAEITALRRGMLFYPVHELTYAEFFVIVSGLHEDERGELLFAGTAPVERFAGPAAGQVSLLYHIDDFAAENLWVPADPYGVATATLGYANGDAPASSATQVVACKLDVALSLK